MSGERPLGPMMPYRVLRDFLPAEQHRALLEWTLANEAAFRPAPLAGGVVNAGLRKALVLRDLGPVGPALETRIAALRHAPTLAVC